MIMVNWLDLPKTGRRGRNAGGSSKKGAWCACTKQEVASRVTGMFEGAAGKNGKMVRENELQQAMVQSPWEPIDFRWENSGVFTSGDSHWRVWVAFTETSQDHKIPAISFAQWMGSFDDYLRKFCPSLHPASSQVLLHGSAVPVIWRLPQVTLKSSFTTFTPSLNLRPFYYVPDLCEWQEGLHTNLILQWIQMDLDSLSLLYHITGTCWSYGSLQDPCIWQSISILFSTKSTLHFQQQWGQAGHQTRIGRSHPPDCMQGFRFLPLSALVNLSWIKCFGCSQSSSSPDGGSPNKQENDPDPAEGERVQSKRPSNLTKWIISPWVMRC